MLIRELFERAVGLKVEDRTAIAGVQDKVSGRMINLPVAHRETCDVPAKATARVLDELCAAAPKWLERLQTSYLDQRVVPELRQACSYRVQRLG